MRGDCLMSNAMQWIINGKVREVGNHSYSVDNVQIEGRYAPHKKMCGRPKRME